MKKIFFAILIAAVVNGNAVANIKAIDNPLVAQSFEREFAGAHSVKWEVLDGKEIYHAFFVYNNEPLNAYFNEEGTLLGTGRYLKFENLPMLTAKSIKEKYSQLQCWKRSSLVRRLERVISLNLKVRNLNYIYRHIAMGASVY